MKSFLVTCRAPGVDSLWIRHVNAEYEADAVDSGSQLCAREVGRNWADVEVVDAVEMDSARS